MNGSKHFQNLINSLFLHEYNYYLLLSLQQYSIELKICDQLQAINTGKYDKHGGSCSVRHNGQRRPSQHNLST